MTEFARKKKTFGIWNAGDVRDLRKIEISECLRYYFIFDITKEMMKSGK